MSSYVITLTICVDAEAEIVGVSAVDAKYTPQAGNGRCVPSVDTQHSPVDAQRVRNGLLLLPF
jgi:hypothetical protein